ncbi:Hypothetical predicted protein [Olea europaea subsp. europaea]|uniref:Uncharacterized protein n=1 Tax=Olea europaea subsp. europaea TaxID=158383 RepID=A0A8S0QAJ1_OLEEU|nr:Hypothetical predicted protein [Olea europaea subsp. europaea]
MRPPRGHDNFGGYGFRGKRNGGGCGSCFDGGSFYPSHDEGPLDEVIEVSSFAHAYEADVVTKLTNFFHSQKDKRKLVVEGEKKGGERGGRGGGYFHGRGAPRRRDGSRGGGRGGGFRGRGRS